MKFYIFFILALILSSSLVHSDETKGKEFIATFLPNYHNRWSNSDDRYRYGDSVYLFIYSENQTNVNIEYFNQLGQKFNEDFNIPANSIYTFKKPSYDFALIGFNRSGNIDFRNNSERVSNLSFRIKSEQPIVVYGHSQAETTSESFNVLPIESLGNEYIVAAYNSSRFFSSVDFPISHTPSQFAIVAIEDGTEVQIDPSVSTRFNQRNKQNIKLNKNEVYLVQANISSSEQYLDLTGSYVKSNKPIAVFGGHQRAAVPYNVPGQSPSRDYLVEQIPTIESWSLETYVVPFKQPSIIETTFPDIFRILAAFDNTDIFIDDEYYGTLNKGKFFELSLNSAFKVRGSAPILVVAYKRSSQTSASNTLGDPLMQILPSTEQYGNSYKFINIQAYQYNGGNRYDRVYDEHFITLIVPGTSLNKLVLDEVPLNTSNFTRIEGTDFYYGYKQVGEGIHTIYAPDNFGLFVAGYGYANSYGYFSGIITKRDDFEPPSFQSDIECYKVVGKVEDKKIATVTSDESRLNNIKLTFEQFTPFVKELNFEAELINFKQDGKARVVAKDSIGYQNYLDINIPGFTVGLASFNNLEQIEPQMIYDTLQFFESKCYNFTLKNYGNFVQTIEKSILKIKANFTTDLPSSFSLEPKQSIDFSVCLNADSNSVFIDTLFIESKCFNQNILVFDLLSKKDENKPVLTSKIDPCKEIINIVITDSAKTDRGIKELVIDQQVNIDLVETTRNKSFINLSAVVIDPYQDSYLSLTVIDSAGFEVTYKDTIPGFTIQLNGVNDQNQKLDFGNKKIGIEHCEFVSLTNYGNFELALNDVNLNHNIYFSIPLNQLPFSIKPGETKELEVCFKGYIASKQPLYDTLHLKYNCLEKLITLESVPDSLIINNGSRCDVTLILSSGKIENQNTIGKIYPNPANGKINFTINNANQSLIIGKIFSMSGELIYDYLDQNFEKGIYDITVNTNSLENGAYINVVYINNEKFSEIFIINK